MSSESFQSPLSSISVPLPLNSSDFSMSSSVLYPARIYYTCNLQPGIYSYDILTGRYSIHSTPPITFHNTSTCSLPNGDIFLAGSYIIHSYSPMAYIYKPNSGRVIRLQDMKVPRNCISLICYKGHVYGFGGYNDLFLQSAERYSLNHNRWKQLPDMIEARFYSTCVGVENKIYIFAGGSVYVEIYDIKYNRFLLTEVSIFSKSAIANLQDDSIHIICNSEVILMDKDLRITKRLKKRVRRNCQTISNTCIDKDTLFYFNISSLEIEKFRFSKEDENFPYAKWLYDASAKSFSIS